MLRKFAQLLLVLSITPVVFGQAALYNNFASTVSNPGPGGYPNILAIPGAKIQICNNPAVIPFAGSPCTNLATTYTDETQSVSCPSDAQLVYQGSNGCTNITDRAGNFGFWGASTTHFQYTLTLPTGQTVGPVDIWTPFTGVVPDLITKLPWVNVRSFGADNTCVLDSTSNIQAAENYVESLANGASTLTSPVPILYFPYGCYKTSQKINLKQGVSIHGDGPNDSIIFSVGTGVNVFEYNAVGNGTVGVGDNLTNVDGISIVGSGKISTGDAFELVSVQHFQLRDFQVYNWGGRAVEAFGNTERLQLRDCELSGVRIAFSGTFNGNETYSTNCKVSGGGTVIQAGNLFGIYCYNINCDANGNYPSSGGIKPDHHAVIYLHGNNMNWEDFSCKTLAFISCIIIDNPAQNGTVKNGYFETAFGGIPNLNSSVIMDGQQETTSLVTGLSTGGLTATVSMPHGNWFQNYINDDSDVNIVGNAGDLHVHIMCPDAAPGSTNPCADGQSGVTQGQFEVVTLHVFTNSNTMYLTSRCNSGSTVTCTANVSGPAWLATSLVVQPIGGAQGTYKLQDNHFNAASRGSVGAYTSLASDTVTNMVSADIIVGPIPDAREVTAPGSTFAGFSGTNFQSRGNINIDTYRASGFCASDEVTGCGWIKIPSYAMINLITGPPINASTLNSTTIPTTQYISNGVGINFNVYANGNAGGIVNLSSLKVIIDPADNLFSSIYTGGTAGSPEQGEQRNQPFLWYDQSTIAPGAQNRGGWLNPGLITQHWNGAQWQTDTLSDSRGFHSNTTLGVGIDSAQNFVVNSTTVAIGSDGWSVRGSSGAVTAGQTDPLGGTTAFLITTAGDSQKDGIQNTASGTIPSTTGPFSDGVWIKASSIGQVIMHGVIDSGNVFPDAIYTAPDTAWHFVAGTVTGPTLSTTPVWGIMVQDTGTPQTFSIWRPQSNQGLSTSVYIGTTGSSLLNPTSVVNAAILEVNGVPVSGATLRGTTGSIGGGAITAGNCATGTASITGATTSMVVGASASSTTGPGPAFSVKARVSAPGTVTVDVCTNLAAGATPTASTYNVSVQP